MKIKISEYRKELSQNLTPYTDEALVLSDLIISFALCIDRKTLFTLMETELNEATVIICNDMMKKFISGIPLQYIFGECWFYGLPVKIGTGCFIPRSDTEVLAAAAIELLPENGSFIDVCSGSGCISLAVATNRPDCTGTALEYYMKPLEYSEENLKSCDNMKVERFDALDPEEYKRFNGLDMVISNPPYIPLEELETLDIHVQTEPRTALDGGEDGLDYYRAIISHATHALKKNGKMLFEVGYNQAEQVAELMEKNGFSVEIRRDFNEIERVVIGQLNK